MVEHTLKINTARFLNYVWPFYNNMHEKVKRYCNFTKKTPEGLFFEFYEIFHISGRLFL